LDGDELAGEVPSGSRMTRLQLAASSWLVMEAITQEPRSSPTPLAGEQLVVEDDLVAEGEGGVGSRSLLAAIGVKGLNLTSKLRVLALWVLGLGGLGVAETATTPARASTRAVAA
jgi:hypothetical protein